MKRVMIALVLMLVVATAPVSFAANANVRGSFKQVVTEGITAPPGVDSVVLSTHLTGAYDVRVGSVTGDGSGITNLTSGNLVGALPALDGSALVNLSTVIYSADGASLQDNAGVFSADPSSVTLQGNTFNGVNGLVQLDGSGYLPALNASNLTNIPGVTKHSFIHGETYTESEVWADSTTITGTHSMLRCTVTVKESPTDGTGDSVRCGNDVEFIDVAIPNATAKWTVISAAGPIAIAAGRGIAFKVTASGAYAGMYGCQLELSE
jgi:hypothetical protein